MPISISGDGPITGITSLNTTVSSTELGYLDGTTSAIQTQFNNTGIWQSWTPTWTNLTVGNAVQIARYTQIGKTVFGILRIQLGSTSSVAGDPVFTLPVNASSNYQTGYIFSIGEFTAHDLGNQLYFGRVQLSTVSSAGFYLFLVNGTYALPISVTSTQPFTWGATDSLNIKFQYEAA